MNRIASTRLDSAAWLEQALGVLALRLRHEVALIRALRGDGRQEGFLGLFVSGDEAETILDEISGRLSVEGAAAPADEIGRMVAGLASARRTDAEGVWMRLAAAFDLTEPELDLLLLAAAPALDPRFGRIYGFLNDDMARRWLTPALALRLLDQHPLDMLSLRRMLAAEAPLRRWRLIEAEGARPEIETALHIAEPVLDRLLGGEGTAPAVRGFFNIVAPAGLRSIAPVPLALIGAEAGGDASAVAMDLAAAHGCDLMLIAHGAFAGLDEAAALAALAGCLREARLERAMPCLAGFDAATPGLRRAAVGALAPPAAVLSDDALGWIAAGLRAEIVAAPVETPRARRARSAALMRGHPAASDALCRRLAETRGVGVVEIAQLLARHEQPSALDTELRLRAGAGLDRLADRVTSDFGFGDLVLPARTRRQLETLIAWRSHGGKVLGDWGLGRLFNKRSGAVALFKGPPGTGKTIAASVVANTLDLALYRIDLSQMVSKYIGETEKNLERLFQTAQAGNVVLFFDEADAIFGRRSEVSDAHDRYANIETAYLLQRLERFEGLVILASNLSQNIDEAFLRRIDLVAEFPTPGEAERLALWQRLEASAAPVSDDVDLGLLASQFELTGGEIRNCILAAAHTAARRGGAIDMACLMGAVGEELVKQGRPIRKLQFGAHYARARSAEPGR